jgi:2-polyprenyl-3-methyl-5-hydroxy-6-metoxy-1,4-benzoquinol methylase
MRVLLIANGPAALAKKKGEEIDSFDGKVVRFNTYQTKGYEEYVGTRTDWWVTCGNPPFEKHDRRFFSSWSRDAAAARDVKRFEMERVPRDTMIRTVNSMRFNHPSTGAMFTNFCLERGIEVNLWGFDFLNPRLKHHYNDDVQKRGPWHDNMAEFCYFHNLANAGKINWFGLEWGESGPIVRWPTPCGKDDDVTWYREPAHDAWYKWFGEMAKGKSVLDVGCGVGKGMTTLKEQGATKVRGQDVDTRLLKENVYIGEVQEFDTNAFDVVTCVDVLEHVVKDSHLMDTLKRIAREAIYVTTPCYARSLCGNIAHCREYTIPQFTNLFEPTEVWSASPDGTVHRTLLLERNGAGYIDHSPEGPNNEKKEDVIIHDDKVPLSTRFNQTVDGEEWAHICGIWRL